MDGEQSVARMCAAMAELDEEMFNVLFPLAAVMAKHMRGGMEALPSRLFTINARLCAIRNEMRAFRTDSVLLKRLAELTDEGLAWSSNNTEHATVAEVGTGLDGTGSSNSDAGSNVVEHESPNEAA